MPHRLLTHNELPPEAANLNFRHFVDGMLTPYLVVDRDLVVVYANVAYLDATQSTLQGIVGRYLFDAFPETEERKNEARKHFELALEGKVNRMPALAYSITGPDGSRTEQIWDCVQTPYYGPDGDVAYVIQHAEDITEKEALRRKNEVIAHELDHRVRNMFSVIHAVAGLAGKNAESVKAFQRDFAGRLGTLNRVYIDLQQSEWEGIRLHRILDGALEEHGGQDAPHISLDGPDIRLSPKSSQNIAMLIHELAINAAQHGSLADPAGRLDINWQLSGNGKLILDWVESGLSGIREPEMTGFGTRFASFVPEASVQRNYRDEGLAVRIELTLPETDDS